ncbi:MAG: hypothetical protein Q9187_001142, partial [Circinaria calcarea]
LVVIIASIARSRSSLALGNVIGSAISNILGAFSLGLLFYPHEGEIKFDRSSKLYSLLLLLLAAFVTVITFFGKKGTWSFLGGLLLVLFVVYVISVAWAITRGIFTPPELSDSDDDDDTQESHSDSEEGNSFYDGIGTSRHASQDVEVASPLLKTNSIPDASSDPQRTHPRLCRLPHHRLIYHVAFLSLGLVSICLSGYVLSHASTTISDELGISDVLFGIVILSIATTLPEKFIAVISGVRGHAGILVANTVGSNIFLLALCMGIVLVFTAGDFDAGSVNAAELGVLMGSTVAVTATVWFGGSWSRWIGGVMLAAYVVFLVLEFTLIRKA